jgi:hypothetical protein
MGIVDVTRPSPGKRRHNGSGSPAAPRVRSARGERRRASNSARDEPSRRVAPHATPVHRGLHLKKARAAPSGAAGCYTVRRMEHHADECPRQQPPSMKRQASRESHTGRRRPPTCPQQAEWLQQPNAALRSLPRQRSKCSNSGRGATLPGCSNTPGASINAETVRLPAPESELVFLLSV